MTTLTIPSKISGRDDPIQIIDKGKRGVLQKTDEVVFKGKRGTVEEYLAKDSEKFKHLGTPRARLEMLVGKIKNGNPVNCAKWFAIATKLKKDPDLGLGKSPVTRSTSATPSVALPSIPTGAALASPASVNPAITAAFSASIARPPTQVKVEALPNAPEHPLMSLDEANVDSTPQEDVKEKIEVKELGTTLDLHNNERLKTLLRMLSPK